MKNIGEYLAYLQTDHWKEMRRLALDHAEHRCQLCNATENLEAHHRTYERIGRERLSDLTVLCSDCHYWHHGRARDRRHGRLRDGTAGEPSLIVPIARYEALSLVAEGLWSVLQHGGLGDIRELLTEALDDIDKTPGVLPYTETKAAQVAD